MRMIYNSEIQMKLLKECLIDQIKFWKVILSKKISENSNIFSNKLGVSDSEFASQEIKRLKKKLKDLITINK